MVPIVVFDQLYSFEREALVKAIPKPEKITAQRFETAAAELFDRILQMADNAGATDEHRALNYCAVRYPAVYATAADAHGRDYMLTAVEVHPSRLSGVRKVVEVIFSYNHRQTDVTDKFFCRVDVTEEFASSSAERSGTVSSSQSHLERSERWRERSPPDWGSQGSVWNLQTLGEPCMTDRGSTLLGVF